MDVTVSFKKSDRGSFLDIWLYCKAIWTWNLVRIYPSSLSIVFYISFLNDFSCSRSWFICLSLLNIWSKCWVRSLTFNKNREYWKSRKPWQFSKKSFVKANNKYNFVKIYFSCFCSWDLRSEYFSLNLLDVSEVKQLKFVTCNLKHNLNLKVSWSCRCWCKWRKISRRHKVTCGCWWCADVAIPYRFSSFGEICWMRREIYIIMKEKWWNYQMKISLGEYSCKSCIHLNGYRNKILN